LELKILRRNVEVIKRVSLCRELVEADEVYQAAAPSINS
jgi:hypothetical protein